MTIPASAIHLVGQYQVVRPLAHGGVGWIYLARDTHLDDRLVVLKGLINAQDPAAVEAAVSERRYLVTLDHPKIVRILDFVEHPDPDLGVRTGYTVMEYVGGWLLEAVKQASRTGNHLLRVEEVIEYGLQILEALEYLHGRGVLYCDLKPDNVIHRYNEIKLIDMGAVCPIDHPGPAWGTERYRVSTKEIKTRGGMKVDMDLYTVGKTLRALFSASMERSLFGPAATDMSIDIAAGLESFRFVVDRACDEEWTRRFGSASEMREQLHGVLRQITALRGATLSPRESVLFAPRLSLFDDGLGRQPPLDGWIDVPAGKAPIRAETLADGRPSLASVAVGLPEPRTDPADPAAGSWPE